MADYILQSCFHNAAAASPTVIPPPLIGATPVFTVATETGAAPIAEARDKDTTTPGDLQPFRTGGAVTSPIAPIRPNVVYQQVFQLWEDAGTRLDRFPPFPFIVGTDSLTVPPEPRSLALELIDPPPATRWGDPHIPPRPVAH